MKLALIFLEFGNIILLNSNIFLSSRVWCRGSTAYLVKSYLSTFPSTKERGLPNKTRKGVHIVYVSLKAKCGRLCFPDLKSGNISVDIT